MNTKFYKFSMVTFVVATVLYASGYGLNQQSNTNKNNSINKVKKTEQGIRGSIAPRLILGAFNPGCTIKSKLTLGA